MAAGYMLLFIIRPWERLFPSFGEYKVERIYVALMLCVVLWQGISFRGQIKSVLAFIGAILVSCLCAQDSAIAWEQFYQHLPQFVFFFVLLCVIRSQRELNLMIVTFLFALGLYISKANWEFYVHGAHHTAQGVHRMFGIDKTEADPNALAMHTVCSLPLAVYVFKNRLAIAAQTIPAMAKLLWLACVGYGLVAVVTILQSQSRAGMLGLVAACFLMSFSLIRGGKNIVRAVGLAFAMVVVLWIVLPDSVRGRIRTVWDPSSASLDARTSAEGRLNGLYAGMTMFSRFPIAGVGLGNFVPYRQYHVDGGHLVAHNVPGQVLGEFGLLGAIAFVTVVWVGWGNVRKTRQLARQFRGNPQMTMHENLALSCRNIMLLMLFFGLVLHNALKYDWWFVIAFSSLNLVFATSQVQRLQQIGRRRGSQSGMRPQFSRSLGLLPQAVPRTRRAPRGTGNPAQPGQVRPHSADN